MLKHIAAMLLLAAVTGSGCTVIRERPETSVSGPVKQDPGYVAGKQLLKAYLANDAKAFRDCLPESLQERFPEDLFRKSRKSITDSVGEPVAFSYVTKLEMPSLTPHIWKIRFFRTGRRDGKEYYSEILFRVVTGMADGKAVITSFQFI